MNSRKMIILVLLMCSNLVFSQWLKINTESISWEATSWAIDAIDSNTAIISVNKGYPEFAGLYFTQDKGITWIDITPDIQQ